MSQRGKLAQYVDGVLLNMWFDVQIEENVEEILENQDVYCVGKVLLDVTNCQICYLWHVCRYKSSWGALEILFLIIRI